MLLTLLHKLRPTSRWVYHHRHEFIHICVYERVGHCNGHCNGLQCIGIITVAERGLSFRMVYNVFIFTFSFFAFSALLRLRGRSPYASTSFSFSLTIIEIRGISELSVDVREGAARINRLKIKKLGLLFVMVFELDSNKIKIVKNRHKVVVVTLSPNEYDRGVKFFIRLIIMRDRVLYSSCDG